MKLSFVSTILPRQCGLATFTQNLIGAIEINAGTSPMDFQLVAITDKEELLEYPSRVKYKINQHSHQDYLEIARALNNDGTDLCLIQHEFGIYGGDAGVYVLSLIDSLNIPVIVTLHTVLKRPSFIQRAIIKALGAKAQKLVVMSAIGAGFLNEVYEIPFQKIMTIEHGVPDLSHTKTIFNENELDFNKHQVLLTFGLLSRNKGIEQVIQALPKVVKKHPNVVYMILGKTHPNILNEFGEKYRNYLKFLIKQNNLEQHVIFMNEFISEETLFKYLLATDIYLTPYLNEAQVTSGTLCYAVGAGTAVISTPYWHATELLADGRGCLFNFGDINQLAEIINDLLDNPEKLNNIRSKAFEYGQNLTWGKVGGRYVDLIEAEVDIYQSPDVFIDYVVDPFPMPEFDHLERLTDDTGIIQHAIFGIPNLKEGYCLDDNSRALLTALMAYNIVDYKNALNLIPIYFSYIHYMQNVKGTFRNFLSFNRQFLDEEGSEDAFGRTVWALGYLIKHAPNSAYCQLAEEIFLQASENFEKLRYNRGIANTIIGISYYLQKMPGDEKMEQFLNLMTDTLADRYHRHKTDNWLWFEDELSYDNGILPMSLFHAVMINGSKSLEKIAVETTKFLDQITTGKGYLSPVGSNGWFSKEKMPAQYAQQATDVLAMVLLNYRAFLVTKKKSYLQSMYLCYQWFLGENDLRIPLYDYETHGCCDGLEATGVNRNQGAESTLAYLISNLTIQKARSIENNQSFLKISSKPRKPVLEVVQK